MAPDKPKPHYSILTVLVERSGNALTQEQADDLLLHKLRTFQIENKDLSLTIVRKKGENSVFEDVIP